MATLTFSEAELKELFDTASDWSQSWISPPADAIPVIPPSIVPSNYPPLVPSAQPSIVPTTVPDWRSKPDNSRYSMSGWGQGRSNPPKPPTPTPASVPVHSHSKPVGLFDNTMTTDQTIRIIYQNQVTLNERLTAIIDRVNKMGFVLECLEKRRIQAELAQTTVPPAQLAESPGKRPSDDPESPSKRTKI